jgi:elongation factor G
MILDQNRTRNIGISAHIDSGKTTLTERILYYTKRIHAMHDVKGKDGVGAKMDSMDLERERGITIQSAATYCGWSGYHVNIIDTPGHVDFTIEVERSLRVLDGAILVLCAVAGVQSQSITVDRQMRRYKVPRLAFVNKCDRAGANPERVAQQLCDKLKHHAVLIQLPIGLEADFGGIIDLVTMEAIYYDGEKGDDLRRTAIPVELQAKASAAREHMLEEVSHYSDELMEAILEGKDVPADMIHAAIRSGVISQQLTPVLIGSAYKNKGVQTLLDAVTRYLPNPMDIPNEAIDLATNERITLASDPAKPLVSLAFKLQEERYGQLTYVRVYQGTLAKGESIVNARTRRRVKVGRLVRMHSDEMEDIDRCEAGDIVALFGIDCQSGDSFTSEELEVAMTSIFVPAPVMHLSVKPVDSKAEANMNKALARFTKEDPTFHARYDDDAGETVVSGMGELHLEVYVERMKREYGCEVEVGRPQVSYKETITQLAEFDYTHKKQTGGSGQYARICGFIEPHPDGTDYEFVNDTKGASIPVEFIPACDKGFKAMVKEGPLIGSPVVRLRATVNDGNSHAVDSSDIAFQVAAHGAFRQAYEKAKPILLEPIMKLSVEGPAEMQGGILRTILQRRGMIIGTTEEDDFTRVDAHVPLSEMFGYSTDLRSATQGKAEFTMEFERHAPAPREVQEKLIQEAQQKRAAGKK